VELLIKINNSGDSPLDYQDGDVVDAISLSTIRLDHASRLCDPDLHPFDDVSGLRVGGTVLEKYLSKVKRYKFERLNDREVKLTDLTTGVESLISDEPNEEGEHLFAEIFIAKGLRSDRHLFFGSQGLEYWFGGARPFIDHSEVWDAIEGDLGVSREIYSTWDFSPLEMMNFLPMKVEGSSELSDGTTDERRSPLVEVVGFDDELGDIIETRAKRKWSVPYWDLTQDIGVAVDDVRNLSKEVDARYQATQIDATTFEKEI
jgi:hypothetical protein